MVKSDGQDLAEFGKCFHVFLSACLKTLNTESIICFIKIDGKLIKLAEQTVCETSKTYPL